MLTVYLEPTRCSRHDIFHMHSYSLCEFIYGFVCTIGQVVSYQELLSHTLSAVSPQCKPDDYILEQGFVEKACATRKVKSARIAMIMFFLLWCQNLELTSIFIVHTHRILTFEHEKTEE